MQYLTIGIRFLLGTVFLVSSLSKVTGRGAFETFAASIRDLGLAPTRTVRPLAGTVVAVEFAVWTLLAVPLPVTGVAGLLVAAALLLVFSAGIAVSLRRGTRTACRCFGASTVALGLPHVVRNAVLAALAAAAAPATLEPTPTHLGGAALAAVAGTVLGLLVAAGDDIAELLHPMSPAPDLRRGPQPHRRGTKNAGTGRGPHPRRADRHREPAAQHGHHQATPRAH
ncbi:MauE/DoxX family redox-associated membrane protein [Micromonospora sp. NPDC001898]|uniref:MauE/DoxX family redox-associated membrane protein n=1 Tax=Micromonospora sp. NPDC001898 TaxID=3364221 RepID=UPI003674F907